MIIALILFFLLAIVVSFLCSMWEAVLLSITPSYAQVKLKEGSRIGKLLKNFKESIDRPLAAILTLNTIAHTVGAVGVGNQATKIWAETDSFITGLVVPVVMTLAILILSELIPKTLGANLWKELTPFTVRSLDLIIRFLFPLVWFSQFITGVLNKEKGRSVFSRKDFLALTEVGAEQGVIEEHESNVISSLLKFNEIRAVDVMTPRVIVKAASRTLTIGEFYEVVRDSGVSRIPLYRDESKDSITGYVLKDELLASLVDNRAKEPVYELERKIISVPEDFPIPELFKRFIREREHIALVLGDFGGMSGVVTMEDVIETMLGMEIVDEMDHAEDLQALARENWQKRAKAMGFLDGKDDNSSENSGKKGA